jgi:hypothetical protein
MSQSSSHALSTRLFIQAALTGLLAPSASGGSTWLVVTLAVAAGAVAVALLLRSAASNAKQMVIGFEGVALAVGGLGMAGGHYIPGTIIGVVTLITAFNLPSEAVSASPDQQWVAPPAAFAAPVMGNDYAPQAAVGSIVPPQAAAPAPVEAPASAPAPPQNVPPAPRSMTILPGK